MGGGGRKQKRMTGLVEYEESLRDTGIEKHKKQYITKKGAAMATNTQMDLWEQQTKGKNMATNTQIDSWEQQTDLFNSDLARFMLASNEIHGILNTEFHLAPRIEDDEGSVRLVGFFRGLGSEYPAVLILLDREGAWMVIDHALITDSDVFIKLQKVADSYRLVNYSDSNKLDGAMKHYAETVLGDMWLVG